MFKHCREIRDIGVFEGVVYIIWVGVTGFPVVSAQIDQNHPAWLYCDADGGDIDEIGILDSCADICIEHNSMRFVGYVPTFREGGRSMAEYRALAEKLARDVQADKLTPWALPSVR